MHFFRNPETTSQGRFDRGVFARGEKSQLVQCLTLNSVRCWLFLLYRTQSVFCPGPVPVPSSSDPVIKSSYILYIMCVFGRVLHGPDSHDIKSGAGLKCASRLKFTILPFILIPESPASAVTFVLLSLTPSRASRLLTPTFSFPAFFLALRNRANRSCHGAPTRKPFVKLSPVSAKLPIVL